MTLKAIIATGTAAAVLCGLGTWQVKRLHWKMDLQESIDQAYADDAALPTLDESDLDEVNSSHIVRGQLKGRLLLDHEVIVGPKKDPAGRNAYDVITPLRLDSGDIVLVNRGKIFTENFTDPRPQTGESGSIRAVITGLVQEAPTARFSFLPQNDPENDNWILADAEEIAAHEKLENVRPLLVQAEKSSVAKDNLELRDPVAPTLRNDHLQYAIFWYTMSAIVILISFLRFRKRKSA